MKLPEALRHPVKFFLDPKAKQEGGIPNRELTLYSLGVAGHMHIVYMMNWLTYFCDTVLAIPANLVGWITGVSRLWDGVNDPLVGAIMDRRRFRSGEKLRPYFKYTAPVVGIFSTLMFVDFRFQSKTTAMVMILIFYLIFDTFMSFQETSIWGLTAMMSTHSEERGRAVQWGKVGVAIGGTIQSLIMPILGFRDRLPFGMNTLFLAFALVLCLASSMAVLLSGAAKERVPNPPENKEESIFSNLWVVKSNYILLLLGLASIVGAFAPHMPDIYVYQDVTYRMLGQNIPGETAKMMIDAIASIPGTFGLLLATKFAKKIGGMKNVMVVSSVAGILTRTLNYFIGYQTFPRFVLIHVIGLFAGVTGIMSTIAITALWGDSIDYLEWKTGKRTEGISFSLQNLLGKAAGGIQQVMRGQLLTWLLYDGVLAQQKIPQNAKFLRWVWPLNQLGPALGALVSLVPILCIRYPDAMKRQVEADLAERRARTEAILSEESA